METILEFKKTHFGHQAQLDNKAVLLNDEILPKNVLLQVQLTEGLGHYVVEQYTYVVPALIREEGFYRDMLEVYRIKATRTIYIPLFRFNPHSLETLEEVNCFLQLMKNDIICRMGNDDMWTSNTNLFYKSPIGLVNTDTWLRFWKEYILQCKQMWVRNR